MQSFHCVDPKGIVLIRGESYSSPCSFLFLVVVFDCSDMPVPHDIKIDNESNSALFYYRERWLFAGRFTGQF